MSDFDTIWQELSTSALLGTERRPPALPASGGALSDFLSLLDPSDPPHYLLGGAGVVSLYRQAGRLPAQVSDVEPAPCPADELPRCSPAAAARLVTMLAGGYKDSVPEWLALAAYAKKRVPEELLPDLIAWGQTHLDQIESLLPVLGNRGRWLATQIPSLEYVHSAVMVESIAKENIEAVWQTGKRAIRGTLLERLRRTDPGTARGLLASTWNQESADERAAFLNTFKTGLSMDDEPFIEAALDDRARSVRVEAAGLLARLPESRLAKRQLARAENCLKFQAGGFLRKAQLLVSLPESCDNGMVRDGVEPKRIGKKLGEKAQWLLQILEAVPPTSWNQSWGKQPAELLDIAKDGEWKELLFDGWTTAAIHYQDENWAKAILAADPKRRPLLNVLIPAQRQDFILARIKEYPDEGLELLLGYDGAWGPALTQYAIEHIRVFISRHPTADEFNIIRSFFYTAGKGMDPSLAVKLSANLIDQNAPYPNWDPKAEKLLELLDFRHQMMEELR